MHRITMTYEASNPHTGGHRASVETDRDGSLDHACETFKSFLIACGYAPETVDRMVIEWADELQTPNASFSREPERSVGESAGSDS